MRAKGNSHWCCSCDKLASKLASKFLVGIKIARFLVVVVRAISRCGGDFARVWIRARAMARFSGHGLTHTFCTCSCSNDSHFVLITVCAVNNDVSILLRSRVMESKWGKTSETIKMTLNVEQVRVTFNIFVIYSIDQACRN